MPRTGSSDGTVLSAALALLLPPVLMALSVAGAVHWPASEEPPLRLEKPAVQLAAGSPGKADDVRLRGLDADCEGCHPAEARRFFTTTHGILAQPAIYQGCGACHEGSTQHALDGDPASIATLAPGAAADALCQTCHLGAPEHVREWPNHEYAAQKPSCLSCHPVHVPGPEERRPLAALAEAASETEHLGTLNCALCHAELYHELSHTSHAALQDPARSEEGCEGCHGPGGTHYLAGGDPTEIRNPLELSLEEADAVCAGCHQAELDLHAEAVAEFQSRGLRCTSCHPAHRLERDRQEQLGWPSLEHAMREAEPVGDERCADCHPSPHPGFDRSFHATLADHGGCEGCHGPASLHVGFGGSLAAIVRPDVLPGRQSSEVCLSCHDGQTALHGWDGGAHARANVACLDCHPSNGERGSPLAAPQPEVCGACHANVVAQFRLPNHHRVLQGDLDCMSCHDPHAGRRRLLDKTLTEESCVDCHRERRGPFIFEHEADRSEGCVICHQPHGSANRKLLNRARSRDVCLQCHGGLPASHDQRPGSPYRNCVSCHTEFHGSNLHPLFLR